MILCAEPGGSSQEPGWVHSIRSIPCAELGADHNKNEKTSRLSPSVPDVFGGIQFRSVGRQVLDADTAVLGGHESLHQPAAMRGQAVPHQQQLSGNVPQ